VELYKSVCIRGRSHETAHDRALDNRYDLGTRDFALRLLFQEYSNRSAALGRRQARGCPAHQRQPVNQETRASRVYISAVGIRAKVPLLDSGTGSPGRKRFRLLQRL